MLSRSFVGLLLLVSGLGFLTAPAAAKTAAPGCAALAPKACVDLAIDAMGGAKALRALANVRLDIVQGTLLTEQSYRQAPFLTAYYRSSEIIDFSNRRMFQSDKGLWPEADPDLASAEVDSVVVSTPDGAVVKTGGADAPGPLSRADATLAALDLGPERILLTAAAAGDLHFEPAEGLRSTPHTVVAFHWRGLLIKVLLNRYNHLPDAVETTRTFKDFWSAWGDVQQRIYLDNWKLVGAVVYPTNRIEERNGVLWRTSQVLQADFNIPVDEKDFAMNPEAMATSAKSLGYNLAFDDQHAVELAPGMDLYQGAWNVTLVKQDKGVLVLEAPISPTFTAGVLEKARRAYPGQPILAVLSTSDSWPHVAGVREAVAQRLPVYILDLNRPLLERMVNAPHRLEPDREQAHPALGQWREVSGRTEVGEGTNRAIVYPLRGASTERQYMVYFPEHRLLYASDTLVMDSDLKKIYSPELTLEVVRAVAREHLEVDTVYAMHQAPVSWSVVTKVLGEASEQRTG